MLWESLHTSVGVVSLFLPTLTQPEVREETKVQKIKVLADVCLHCLFTHFGQAPVRRFSFEKNSPTQLTPQLSTGLTGALSLKPDSCLVNSQKEHRL